MLRLARGALLLLLLPGWPASAAGTASPTSDESAPEAAEASTEGAVADLASRVVAAYGGAEAISRVQAYRMSGRVEARMRGAIAPTLRIFERPQRLLVRNEYPGGTEVRLLDGDSGWRNRRGEPPVGARGPMLNSMILQAVRAGLLWHLVERRDQLRPLEPIEADGRTLLGIEVPLRAGLRLVAWIDPDSHRVVRSVGVLQAAELQTAFETRYFDFREVEGVWFAHREETFASGLHTATITFDQVTLNPELPDDTFRP